MSQHPLRKTKSGQARLLWSEELRKWIVTFGGSGLSPVAPGTAGSLATAAVLYGIYILASPAGGPVNPVLWNSILLSAICLASIGSVALGEWAVKHFGREDPGPFVLDEVGGMCVTGLLLPCLSAGHEAIILLLMFAMFRLFDILKPPPARQLEHLPAGWGILLDDLAAGVYANLACQLLLRVVLPKMGLG